MNPNDQSPPPVQYLAVNPGKPYDILRLPIVLRVRGRSRTMHYRDIKMGLFTPPVSIGARAVGWPSFEVAALNEARIAGRSEDEIRILVAELKSARNPRQGSAVMGVK